MKFSRKVDKPLILYGAGKLGKMAAEVMGKIGIDYMFVDGGRADGSLHPADVADYLRKDYLAAVCVTTEPFFLIERSLQDLGYVDIVSVYDIFNAYPECGITNGWTHNGRWGLSFGDPQSDWQYACFFSWHLNRFEPFVDSACRYPRYYVPEIVALTSTRFPEEGSTLAEIEARRQVVTLDAPQDYIRLHLEGCELATLRKNRARLQKHRPILAVCCYHSRDGLYKIPKWCMDNLEGYRFLFRMHSYMGQGAVLYCIPKEKEVMPHG